MKRLLIRAVRLLAGLFYRRVETGGLENVPRKGPVLLVANHDNSLVDPMLVVSALDRPVVFVAKSTLWKVPVLRNVIDTLGVVPIIRRADVASEGEPGGADRNEPSFERLASVLRAGGAVLIFPEGRSHSDPALSAVRTGAARILLRAGVPVPVVPVGLWFTRKEEFRSDVLVEIGAPLTPPEVPTAETWTEVIRRGLVEVTLNASSWAEHDVVRAVEAIYGAALDDGPPTLQRTFRNRRVLLQARAALEKVEPGAVSALARRARAYERLLHRVGLSTEEIDELPPAHRVLGYTLQALLFVVLGFPVAVLGIVAFFVPYRLVGIFATKRKRPDLLDQLAFEKILLGVLLFPSFLALEVYGVSRLGGLVAAACAAIVLPLAGLISLRYLEAGERDERRLKGLLAILLSPDRMASLRRERDALRAECDRLAAVYRALGDNRGA